MVSPGASIKKGVLNQDAEANTQAEFYHHCRLIELQVCLDIHTPAGRLDCAILTHDRSSLVAIIEVKNPKAPFVKEQIDRYKKLGVPVYGLKDFSHARKLAETIKKRHEHDHGIHLEKIRVLRINTPPVMPRIPNRPHAEESLNFKGVRLW